MPLDTYRAKRDFTRSPEPSGERRAGPGDGRLFFCVQKHLASHLHYDFRLEHDGVLLSWAVPKGPALDPSIKRFATQVEHHPVEYGEFEGVIPEGYGAGIVMLWDRGTWEPEVPDVEAALRKGDLKFRLDGFKLKGSWVLVRTRGGPGGDRSNWLLIKHRDEWSGPVDVTEAFPDSVKSGGDFADILADGNPEIWVSNRPARGGQAGQMFERIVERALAMRGAAPGPDAAVTPAKPRARKTAARKTAAVKTTARKTAARKTTARKTVKSKRG
jgi:bifunctional non-homologous end joining protein LigD